jgi:hypothetical protein
VFRKEGYTLEVFPTVSQTIIFESKFKVLGIEFGPLEGVFRSHSSLTIQGFSHKGLVKGKGVADLELSQPRAVGL